MMIRCALRLKVIDNKKITNTRLHARSVPAIHVLFNAAQLKCMPRVPPLVVQKILLLNSFFGFFAR